MKRNARGESTLDEIMHHLVLFFLVLVGTTVLLNFFPIWALMLIYGAYFVLALIVICAVALWSMPLGPEGDDSETERQHDEDQAMPEHGRHVKA